MPSPPTCSRVGRSSAAISGSDASIADELVAAVVQIAESIAVGDPLRRQLIGAPDWDSCHVGRAELPVTQYLASLDS